MCAREAPRIKDEMKKVNAIYFRLVLYVHARFICPDADAHLFASVRNEPSIIFLFISPLFAGIYFFLAQNSVFFAR